MEDRDSSCFLLSKNIYSLYENMEWKLFTCGHNHLKQEKYNVGAFLVSSITFHNLSKQLLFSYRGNVN